MKSPLVLFDLGGVIVRVADSAENAALRAGIPWRAPTCTMDEAKVQELLDQWQRGILEDELFFSTWAKAIGGRFNAQEARTISEHWLLGEYEGMKEIGLHLHDQGLEFGCLSNTCHHHWEIMLRQKDCYPTIASMNHRHASHVLGCLKPERQIFEKIENLLGLGGPNIVYFDDLIANVQAAKGMGWFAFVIEQGCEPSEQVRNHLANVGFW